ncbi:MAG: hypothetical protein R6U31_03155 [bacterium]
MPRTDFMKLQSDSMSESSEDIRERVESTVEKQNDRYSKLKHIRRNAHLTSRYIKRYCSLDNSSVSLLKNAVEHYGFSPRSINKIKKVARTIADMEGYKDIREEHIAEAVQFRILDNKFFYNI